MAVPRDDGGWSWAEARERVAWRQADEMLVDTVVYSGRSPAQPSPGDLDCCCDNFFLVPHPHTQRPINLHRVSLAYLVLSQQNPSARCPDLAFLYVVLCVHYYCIVCRVVSWPRPRPGWAAAQVGWQAGWWVGGRAGAGVSGGV